MGTEPVDGRSVGGGVVTGGGRPLDVTDACAIGLPLSLLCTPNDAVGVATGPAFSANGTLEGDAIGAACERAADAPAVTTARAEGIVAGAAGLPCSEPLLISLPLPALLSARTGLALASAVGVALLPRCATSAAGRSAVARSDTNTAQTVPASSSMSRFVGTRPQAQHPRRLVPPSTDCRRT
jgi:hypothetical protein